MTRREEIQWEAGGIVNRMIERGVSQCYDTYYQAFQDGATWADKTMIEKACSILEDMTEGRLGKRFINEFKNKLTYGVLERH